MPVPPLAEFRGRPGAGQRTVILVVAAAAGIAGIFLTRAVDASPQPGWLLPIAIGVAIGVLAAVFSLQGSRLRVEADGTATYSLHGRRNLSFALGEAAGFRPLERGLLCGVAVDLDPRKVRFLHKTGISPERMRRWRDDLGCDLVLEGLTAADAGALSRLRESVLASSASPASM